MSGIAFARPESQSNNRSLRSARRRSALTLASLQKRYDWAGRPLWQLCQIEPRLADFLRDAPAHTLHYTALALRGMQKRRRVVDAWLATNLASRARRDVLREVWGFDLGSTRALARLGDEPMVVASYDALAIVLADPGRRRAFGDLPRPTDLVILRIADAPDAVIASTRGRLIGRFGAAGVTFLADGIARIRPDLSHEAIQRALNALEKPAKIDNLLTRLSRDLVLPDPPWIGTGTITPLRTVRELRAAGLRLENCLNSLAIWSEALGGQRAFYLVEERELCIVALGRHEVFGTWFVHSLAKRRNGMPARDVKRRIVEAFAAAGLPYFDGAPIGIGLDGDD
ncbi:MAG: hypothetical protein JNK84_10755 [Phreatobacter sp.]|uniref:hypothetical protein n=1 Tax=Phreatobacter sp. TaxID=1966341 RepID=UPI001A4C454D|nr:hypothetical protein [Phreatobacter sp.]MBL8569553.1 hypothetical protein [Phreatobacter sp.]